MKELIRKILKEELDNQWGWSDSVGIEVGLSETLDNHFGISREPSIRINRGHVFRQLLLR